MRTLAALLLLLSSLSGALAGDQVTVCTDDDGDCPPSCTHCVCCSHAPAPALLADGGLSPALGSERQESAGTGQPSPGTSPDILHVPRRFSA